MFRYLCTFAVVAGAGCRSTHPTSTAHVRSLDPGHFRPQIAAIDRIAYDTGVISVTDRTELVTQLDELASRTTHEDGSSTIGALSDELRQLADGLRRQSLDSIREDETLRDTWGRLRDSLFADADWLRRDLRDPIASPDTDASHSRLSRGDAFRRDQLEIAVRDLEDAAADGDRDIAGSSVTPQTDASTRERDAAWQATTREFQARLDKVANELPSAPEASGNPDFATAYRETKLAIASLRTATSWLPSMRQQWMGDAHAHIRVARQYLGRIER